MLAKLPVRTPTTPPRTDMSERKGSDFAGLSVAIITPFADGEVDCKRLRDQVEFQLAAGTTCIVPVGTTGESPTLTHDEHDRVITEVIQCVAGRAKVMAGTGSNSTAEALRLTRRAGLGRCRRDTASRSLLQQANSRRVLSAFQGGG